MSLVQDVLSCGCHHHFTGEIYSGCSFMGVKMDAYFKSKFFIQSVFIFMGMPLLIWAMGSLPARSFLKELLSVVTILAFFQMMGQFYWSRANRYGAKDLKMSRMTSLHKIIGYTFVTVLLLHPVFLVIPRFLESGVAPVDALITILTTFNQGVVLGIIAWCLILIIGITSLTRKKLPMKYKTWRTFHGILAIVFISIAAWHVIDLGRHSSFAMSTLISILAAGGVLLLLKAYTSKTFRKTSEG